MRRQRVWPWGVAPEHPADGRLCHSRWVCLRRHVWYAWCDCGWNRTYRRRRSAATALANHRHTMPRFTV